MEYYSENAKKELENRKAKAEALAEAWANVERVHKKDGGDFANLSQNFKNCTIKMQEWTHNREEKEIKVYTTDANGHSHSDSLNLARTLENFDKVAGELVALREQAHKVAEACGTYSAYILKSIFKESRL